jgi:hypothetical protein
MGAVGAVMLRPAWCHTTICSLFLLFACGDNQDDAGARSLLQKVRAAQYRTWDRAPGYETRQPSDTAHSDAVDIYVNDRIVEVLAVGEPTAAWPVGATVVKEGFSGSDLALIAIIEKRADGWFWAEFDDDGDADYSGRPDLCLDCHRRGSDFVRAFALP